MQCDPATPRRQDTSDCPSRSSDRASSVDVPGAAAGRVERQFKVATLEPSIVACPFE
jgi:hypothetical protein